MKIRRLLAGTIAAAVVFAACSDAADDGSAVAAGGAATTADAPDGAVEPEGSSSPQNDAPGASATTGGGSRSERVIASTSVWPTDWSNTTIDLSELAVGIPRSDPRDAIPPIYSPEYESVADAGAWLNAQDPGALVDVDGDVRFYPLAIMTRHEIVNDTFGDVPVAVTYCPLCNTALAFDRRVDGEAVEFGVSGLLRNSDLVMWDHDTVSLWQQITGEAIVGEHAGTRLERLSTAIVGYGEVVENFPNAQVLSRDLGFGIAYGANPYSGYSSQAAPFPGFADPPEDTRFAALERVVGVTIGDIEKAYAFSTLENELVVNDIVDDTSVAVFWGGSTADALDASSITDSRAIGTAVAFLATLDGRELTFMPDGERFTDAETGSTWTLLGRAIDGPLEGSQLEFAPHRNEFWFAFAAFFPNAAVYGG